MCIITTSKQAAKYTKQKIEYQREARQACARQWIWQVIHKIQSKINASIDAEGNRYAAGNTGEEKAW